MRRGVRSAEAESRGHGASRGGGLMLMLPIEEAQAGMKLVVTVWNPEQPEHELFKPGFVLDDTVLAKLRSLQVPFVYVDYPDLAELDRHLLPHLSPAQQQIYNHIKNTIAAVQDGPPHGDLSRFSATRKLVITLLQQGQHPIYLDILCGRLGTDEVRTDRIQTSYHLELPS